MQGKQFLSIAIAARRRPSRWPTVGSRRSGSSSSGIGFLSIRVTGITWWFLSEFGSSGRLASHGAACKLSKRLSCAVALYAWCGDSPARGTAAPPCAAPSRLSSWARRRFSNGSQGHCWCLPYLEQRATSGQYSVRRRPVLGRRGRPWAIACRVDSVCPGRRYESVTMFFGTRGEAGFDLIRDDRLTNRSHGTVPSRIRCRTSRRQGLSPALIGLWLPVTVGRL